jgi:hypothetical protein
MERNSPGAFGASGTSDSYATLQLCSLYITGTRVCSLAAVLRPSSSAAAPRAAGMAFPTGSGREVLPVVVVVVV